MSGLSDLQSFLSDLSGVCLALVEDLGAVDQAGFVAGIPKTIAASQKPSVAALTDAQLEATKAWLTALVPSASDEIARGTSLEEHLLAAVRSFVPPAAPTPAPVDPTPAPVEPAPAPVEPAPVP